MTEPYTPRHFALIAEAEHMARHAERYIASHMHHQPYRCRRKLRPPDQRLQKLSASVARERPFCQARPRGQSLPIHESGVAPKKL